MGQVVALATEELVSITRSEEGARRSGRILNRAMGKMILRLSLVFAMVLLEVAEVLVEA